MDRPTNSSTGAGLTDAEVTTVEGGSMIGLRAVVRAGELRRWTAQALPVVATALRESRVRPAGPPMSIVRPRPDGTVDVSAGYRIDGAPDIGRLVCEALPAGPVAMAIHRGPYESLLCTYDRLVEWLVGHHHVAGPVLWEEYVVGPDTTGEPAQWRTAVMCPLLPGRDRPDESMTWGVDRPPARAD